MDNKKPMRYGHPPSGPFPVDCSSSESEQNDEEASAGDRPTQVDFGSDGPILAEAPILSFSESVVRGLLLNLSQENGRRLVEIICANYGYSTFTADIRECLSYRFFQRHAVRNGYLLTPTFLSLLNDLRTLFSNHVGVLLNSNNFGSFLFGIDRNKLSLPHLLVSVNNYSLNFSNSAIMVRSGSINFLMSTIIPALVEIINQNTVVRGFNECELSHSDRDQLFLHIVTMFERLIMLRIMNYWNGFCIINKDLLSLLPDADYSDPFIIARDKCCFIIPEVSSPAAFTTVHGIYLSFMAVNYLDNIIKNLVLTLIDVLRPVILEKVTKICGDFIFLKELRESGNRALLPIIHEEFSRVIDTHVGYEITRFLNESLIWSQRELSANELQSFVTGVVDTVYRSVENNLISCCYSVTGSTADSTKDTKESRKVLRKGPVKVKTHFRGEFSISSKCGFNVDENFCEELMNIRLRDLSSFRSIAKKKFTEIIRSRDFSSVDWKDNSDKLMSIVNNEAKDEIDASVKRMKDSISKARIVSSSGEKRDPSQQEQSILLRMIMQYSNRRFRDNIKDLWRRQVFKEFTSVIPGGIYAADDLTGVSSAAGTSRVSAAAGSDEASAAAGPSGVSSAVGYSEASAVSSSREESIQLSSSSVTVKGKSKGGKRKRDATPGVAPSEGRPNIVRSEYGSILVRGEFNDEISRMVSEHLDYADRVFEDIRGDLEEGNSNATNDELVENMRRQSSEAGANILSEFMDRVNEFVSKISVYGDDMKERVIHKNEVYSFMAQLNRVITLRHAEILDKKLEELLIINIVD